MNILSVFSNRNISCLCLTPLLFNLSHSFILSGIALSLDLETGIDIEYMNSDIDIMEVAKSFFRKGKLKI
jgi:phosphopantetheinyl transferase